MHVFTFGGFISTLQPTCLQWLTTPILWFLFIIVIWCSVLIRIWNVWLGYTYWCDFIPTFLLIRYLFTLRWIAISSSHFLYFLISLFLFFKDIWPIHDNAINWHILINWSECLLRHARKRIFLVVFLMGMCKSKRVKRRFRNGRLLLMGSQYFLVTLSMVSLLSTGIASFWHAINWLEMVL